MARRGGGARAARSRILFGYVLREFALSFAVCFLFFFVVFFVNQLLLMAEDVLSRRAPVLDVILLLVYAIPSEVAMAFPFSSLVGALMAAGRLSSDNEFLVMQASGLPARRVFLPFLLLGLVLSIVSFSMNEYFLPLASIQYGKMYRTLIVSSPAVELRPWTARRYKNMTIVTGNVEGGRVDDILIFDKGEEGNDRVISARTASLRSEGSSVVLRLTGVWIQSLSVKNENRVEYSECGEMDYRIDPAQAGQASTVIGPYEMSSFDLGRVIADKARALAAKNLDRAVSEARARADLQAAYEKAVAEGLSLAAAQTRLNAGVMSVRDLISAPAEDRSIQIYKVEYYKKFAIPAGAFCFVLLAFPLGLRAKRAGRSVGFGVGLLVAVAYWAMLLGGSTLGSRLGWSPFWSMWGPDLFVLAAGSCLWLAGRLVR